MVSGPGGSTSRYSRQAASAQTIRPDIAATAADIDDDRLGPFVRELVGHGLASASSVDPGGNGTMTLTSREGYPSSAALELHPAPRAASRSAGGPNPRHAHGSPGSIYFRIVDHLLPPNSGRRVVMVATASTAFRPRCASPLFRLERIGRARRSRRLPGARSRRSAGVGGRIDAVRFLPCAAASAALRSRMRARSRRCRWRPGSPPRSGSGQLSWIAASCIAIPATPQ